MSIPADAPEGFQLKNRMLYGMRKTHPGLFEIKIHYPKMHNALDGDSQM